MCDLVAVIQFLSSAYCLTLFELFFPLYLLCITELCLSIGQGIFRFVIVIFIFLVVSHLLNSYSLYLLKSIILSYYSSGLRFILVGEWFSNEQLLFTPFSLCYKLDFNDRKKSDGLYRFIFKKEWFKIRSSVRFNSS